MVTKRERGRPKKKPAAKKTATKKVANSKIADAQKTARDTLSGQGEADRKARLAEYAKNQQNPTKLEARTGPMATSGAGLDQGKIAERDIGTEASKAAYKIAGLATDLRKQKAAEKPGAREVYAAGTARPPAALSNPDLYGTSTKKRAANLSERITAMDASVQQWKSKGNAVWMGLDPNARTVKIRRSGPQRKDEFGNDTTEEKVGDLILTKDELLSWLSDETKVAQIKAAAEKAGFTISSYDDVAKLWTGVVSQAASSYSLSDKKVTPWALMTLRGKYLVNGRPADKTTTSTSIDEMDPARARLMFEQTAQQALGRAPTKAEVDDFIAKAQTIAKANPSVTTTTHHFGLDGNEESQDSVTKGGQDVVNAQAQVAAMDQARQTEDYAAYQAAGNYFPMLFQALQSPV